MVLSNASKSARHQNSIVNRTNVCGGIKKAGIAPRIGWTMSSNPTLRRAKQRMETVCENKFNITQTQRYGYRATLG